MTAAVRAVRPPAAAGTFYPADPRVLRAAIAAAFADARHGPTEGSAGWPKALVVPHAGYVYSGPVAASAYASLGPDEALAVRRVVLLGPSHFVPLAAIAISSADAFETPLGAVPVDRAAREALFSADAATERDAPHRDEHSLEVQLPFLQTVLGSFELVPLAVGHVAAHAVADALDVVWGGRETLVVVSTDLSHYLDHATASERDRATADAILRGDVEAVGDHDACGASPLRGFMVAAARRALRPELLDLRTSADTAGPPDRVVGYGAFLYR